MFPSNYYYFILNVIQRKCICGYTRLVSVRCNFIRQLISSIFGNRQNDLTAYMAEIDMYSIFGEMEEETIDFIHKSYRSHHTCASLFTCFTLRMQ